METQCGKKTKEEKKTPKLSSKQNTTGQNTIKWHCTTTSAEEQIAWYNKNLSKIPALGRVSLEGLKTKILF